MDLSTQAGQEVLADIERNTSSVRGWRNLMLLCFDQKDIDTFKTLQIICDGLDRLFDRKKLEAKKEFEDAVKAIRESKLKVGQRRLPNPIITAIPFTDLQRQTFLKLARNPNTPSLLDKVSEYYLDEWNLPECAQKHLERALNFEPDDQHVTDSLAKAVEALARSIPSLQPIPQSAPSAEDTRVSFNQTMRLKMPSLLRKASGPLPTERSQTLLGHHIERGNEKQAPHASQTGFKTANLGALHIQLKTLQSKIEMIEKRAHIEPPEPKPKPKEKPEYKSTSQIPLPGLSGDTATPADLISRSLEDVQEGRLDEAAEHCRRALEINPDQPLVWHTWATIGLGYFEERNLDKAIGAFNEALRLEPNAVESWFNMGVAYSEKGDTEGALRCYLRSLFLSPENPKVRCNLGAVYFQNGQFEHADQCFRKAIEINPNYARAWDNLGATLSAQGKLDEAVQACRKAVEIKPDYAEAWFKFGTILFQQDNPIEAQHAFETAASLRQDFPATFVYLAILDARGGKVESAEIACKKFTFLGGAPGLDWMAWQELALAELQIGRVQEAVSAAGHATELQPGEPEPWFTLGVAHHHAGKFEEAEHAYSHCVDISHDMALAWYNLGLVRFELKKYASAADTMTEALRLDSSSALSWYYLGRMREAQRYVEPALEAYRKAVQLDARLVDAWQNLSVLLEEVGRHDEAENAKQNALSALHPA